ncbi:acetyltransferase [Anditalea andensis]|uniref:PglD N-terminal domain-containing protein n=1 Tax=Anditalea andensis TaxID=1048983 RepID=A0A074KXJ2_9BACT|nr:acetyltransferase [Anditalea andensis]KEO72338.1 hypothetical protein EL17_16455 [Anditalea andensis]
MYIIGASGHARVIIDTLESVGEKIEGVFDQNKDVKTCLDYPVGSMENFIPAYEKVVFIAIGNIQWRKKLVLLFDCKVSWGKVLHPAATVSKYSVLGEGTCVMAGAVVQANVEIGRHVIINTHASVDHDCIVGDYSLIAPNVTLCGGAKVGAECLIGAGAILVPGIEIGDNCTVGAGSVILRNIANGEHVSGIVK